MGFLRYIIQGAGWEIGREAAREGLDALEHAADADSAGSDTAGADTVVDAGVQRRRERQRRVAEKKRAAELERQLRELKKRAGRP